jgi:hypothetical protein
MACLLSGDVVFYSALLGLPDLAAVGRYTIHLRDLGARGRQGVTGNLKVDLLGHERRSGERVASHNCGNRSGFQR